MIKFKSKQEREKTRIEKRVEALSTPDLVAWTEQTIYSIGRNLSHWQKYNDEFSLEEARIGAEALHAILDTVSRRTKL